MARRRSLAYWRWERQEVRTDVETVMDELYSTLREAVALRRGDRQQVFAALSGGLGLALCRDRAVASGRRSALLECGPAGIVRRHPRAHVRGTARGSRIAVDIARSMIPGRRSRNSCGNCRAARGRTGGGTKAVYRSVTRSIRRRSSTSCGPASTRRGSRVSELQRHPFERPAAARSQRQMGRKPAAAQPARGAARLQRALDIALQIAPPASAHPRISFRADRRGAFRTRRAAGRPRADPVGRDAADRFLRTASHVSRVAETLSAADLERAGRTIPSRCLAPCRCRQESRNGR